MASADLTPKGLSAWTESDWQKFAAGFGPDSGNYKELHFTGAFGGHEIALLAAVAKQYLPVEFFVATYGFSSMDMMSKWGDDLEAGISDPALDELGINNIEFVESTMAKMMGLLT